MFKRIWWMMFFCCMTVAAFAQMQQKTYSGKVLMKLSPESVAGAETRLKSSDITAAGIFSELSSLDRLNKMHRTDNIKRIFPDAGKYERKHRKYGLHLWYEMSVPDSADLQAVAEEYAADAHVLIAEPAHRIRRMFAIEDGLWVPDDPEFDKQWHFHNTGQTGGTSGVDIRLPEAWAAIDTLGIRNRNVVVAVIDGGVNYLHEDLLPNLWINEAEQHGTAETDDDNNGYIDDVYGFNFVPSSGGGKPVGVIQPEDHATHVAATIAAATNNGKGIAGMTKDEYGIKVMNVQIMNET
ncbi:MAG: S8 family serine peptidase, partial [Bacteroidales bacterium]|nr:S8 family serine peptidase [Bacteroidales bacterium]